MAGYRTAIDRIRALALAAGKKSYTMSMGRINPAKLANFPEVDVFVLVACPQVNPRECHNAFFNLALKIKYISLSLIIRAPFCHPTLDVFIMRT